MVTLHPHRVNQPPATPAPGASRWARARHPPPHTSSSEHSHCTACLRVTLEPSQLHLLRRVHALRLLPQHLSDADATTRARARKDKRRHASRGCREYDRIVAPSSSRPSGNPEGSCCTCRTATFTRPWMPTRPRRSARTSHHNSNPRPSFDLGLAHLDAVGPISPVFLLRNDVDMTTTSRPQGAAIAYPRFSI